MSRLRFLLGARLAPVSAILFSLATLGYANPGSSPGSTSSGSTAPAGSPVVRMSSRNGTSLPLRNLVPIPAPMEGLKLVPLRPLPKAKPAPKGKAEPFDPVVQSTPGRRLTPPPSASFEGVGNVNFALPPDTNGDIGPNHYVQTVNLSFGVFDRSGNFLFGPANINTLFTGFGGPCENTNDGDPIVLYDSLADRWLISQFALPNFPSGPFYQCIAISQTSDPTGAWHRYEFQASASKLNDYPKFGVWPDAYYMSVNQFDQNTLSFSGAGAFAFERDKMLQGLPAQMVYFDLAAVNPAFGGMLPADLDGAAPPAGTPNYFLEMDDDAWGWATDRLSLWEFHVDWATPANSTFGIGGNPNQVLDTAPFDTNLCNYSRNCISQPGGVPVDAISDRLMYRLQYRTFGGYSTLVTNHTVDANGADLAGVRWYELRHGGANWAIHQQGTYAPDSDHRWMGSAALDAAGSLALGYSVSSNTTFPSIRYAGRLAGDPPGTLPQGEQEIVAGAGSQESGSGRWGDYSMMAVDPLDECTFWYTQEYYAATSSGGWQTRVGAFRFEACTTGPSGGLQGTVTEAGSSLPVSGAKVQAAGSTTVTDSNGFYQFLVLPPNSYNMEASKFGYFPQSAPGVAVNAGATAVQDFVLSPRPLTTVQGTVTDASGHGWPLYARLTITELGSTPFFTEPLTGSYSVQLPEGELANFRVAAVSPGYQQVSRGVNVPQGGSTENFGLPSDTARCAAPGYALDFKYFENFEAGNGGFTVAGSTSWQYGTPTSGPGTAFSGTNAWATNLAGSYGDNEDGYLVSPAINLSAFAGQTPILIWQQWLQTEGGFDYGSVEVSNDGGGNWTVVYGEVSAAEELQWTRRSVILDPSFAVAAFRVRFRLRSDGSVVALGFYVDDVAIAVVPQPAPVFSQSFSAGSLPVGWSIVDNLNNGQVWRFDNPGGRDNETGGGGPFAILDSDNYGETGFQDSELRSPAINLSGMATVFLEFNSDFLHWAGGLNEVADVDVSVDGGTSWTNVWRQTSNSRGPRHEVVELTALAGGQSDVRLRFHFYNANWEFWWQLDNVRLYAQATPTTIACLVRSGGLVLGNVYDSVTQLPLVGATVRREDGIADSATTASTPEDGNLNDGFYTLFSSQSGTHPFAAALLPGYDPLTLQVNVVADSVVAQDFFLSPTTNNAPIANAGPDQIVEVTSPSGATVTLNGGLSSDPDNDPLTYTWKEFNATVATGVMPNVTLGPGVHTLTLEVNDGRGGIGTDTMQVTVTDFTATADPAMQTVRAGQTATYTITGMPLFGPSYNTPVTFGCAGLPGLTTCTFTPSNMLVIGSGGNSITLNIRTTAPSVAQLAPVSTPVGTSVLVLAGGMIGLLVFGAAPRGRNLPRARRLLGFLVLGAILTAAVAACGGGGQSGGDVPRVGTPPGSYTVSVTATAGTLQKAFNITLNVQ